MKQSTDPQRLQAIIRRYDVGKMFSFDLTPYASVVEYEANETICRIGETPKHIILLLEGECMASFTTRGGQAHCEMHSHSPNIFGLVGALWQQPAINDVRTLTPCLCLFIPVEKCSEALRSDTRFLNYACRYLANHIRTISQRFDPLPARFARFILQESRNRLFSYNLTICSEILGTSQRHLLRVLREFCDQGLLAHRSKGVYEILDPMGLRAIYIPE